MHSKHYQYRTARKSALVRSDTFYGPEFWQKDLLRRFELRFAQESNKNAKVWLDHAGGEVLGEDYVPLGGSEFTPIFNKIRQVQPDFIFSTVVGNSDIAFHKQFKQEGFKVDKMPIAALTTGEIETRAMGAEFGAGEIFSLRRTSRFSTIPRTTNS